MKRDKEPSAGEMPKDIDTLHFPREITKEIGMGVNEINFLKKKGCPFFGSKTTIRWVRTFIAKQSGFFDLTASIGERIAYQD